MSNPRIRQSLNPLSILKAYCSDPAILEQCRTSSADKFNQGYNTRIFDEFPSFFTKNELDNYAWLFNVLLKSISRQPMDKEDPMRTLSPENKTKIAELATHIALTGCYAFLYQNRPHPELVKLLRWEAFRKKINIGDLISAFTAKTFQDILVKTFQENKPDEFAMHALTVYLDKHNRQFVNEAIAKAGHEFQDRTAETGTPSSTATGVITAGLTALAIVSGIALFSLSSSDRDTRSRDYTRRYHR